MFRGYHKFKVLPRIYARHTVRALHCRASLYGASFLDDRTQIWNRLTEETASPESTHQISITLQNQEFNISANTCTPISLIESDNNISAGTRPIVSLVTPEKGSTEIWDLNRPLEDNCHVELASVEREEGIETVWHSGAHVLGQALELYYKDKTVYLGNGPALETGGFFYDVLILDENNKPIEISIENDIPEIEKMMKRIVKEKQRFERLVLSRNNAEELFQNNPIKCHTIHKLPEDSILTAYRCGEFIDLCRGPHIQNTSLLKLIQILKVSGVEFDDERTQILSNKLGIDPPQGGWLFQRVFGIAFVDKKGYKQWKAQKALQEQYDHRVVGKEQGLFMMHQASPGSPFFLPRGTRIYNALTDFIRKEYRTNGYDEVRTPLIYDKELWETSGHWKNYQENMFIIKRGNDCCGGKHNNEKEIGEEESNTFGLKPMNCPGHCLIYDSETRSYRDLPIRYADFSTLHRNEASGALTGLTRTRAFVQDDAHIFCRPDQIQEELENVFQFIQKVYSSFGFTFYVKLSTRPDKYMGDIELWDQAETDLKACLDNLHAEWTLKEGDGAFYGPKIDVDVKDIFGRRHQCATIQLDFQLPRQFNLKYVDKNSEKATPVMIHRAVMGSIERMMSILIEHTKGKWPLWLSPRQVMVCSVSPIFEDYAKSVVEQLKEKDIYADVSKSGITLNNQIRTAQKAQYNYIVVVGSEEEGAKTVNIRTRDGTVKGTQPIEDFINMLRIEIDEKKK